jgi:hypothetical protein
MPTPFHSIYPLHSGWLPPPQPPQLTSSERERPVFLHIALLSFSLVSTTNFQSCTAATVNTEKEVLTTTGSTIYLNDVSLVAVGLPGRVMRSSAG